MQSFKVDVHYDQSWDWLNVTFNRGPPKAIPSWKGGKGIPKLPPKPKALPSSSTPRPPIRPSINTTRFQQSSDNNTPRITDVTETEDTSNSKGAKSTATRGALKPANGNSKKNIPKLKDTSAPKAQATSKAVKGTSKPQVSEALAPTVSNVVSTAGGVAGDVVCSVGNSINGVGDSISSTIRRYGDAAKNTGNGLKDFTGATGGRAGTATNPLGLSDTKVGGRRAITSPSVPKPIDRKPAATASSQKALPAPKPAVSKSSTAASVKPSTALPKPRPSSINVAKSPALPNTGKALSSASSAASKMSPYKSPSTPAKPSPTTKKVTYSARPKVTGNTAEARNPLGL